MSIDIFNFNNGYNFEVDEKITCPKCGQLINSETPCCPNCGEVFEVSDVEKNMSSYKEDRKQFQSSSTLGWIKIAFFVTEIWLFAGIIFKLPSINEIPYYLREVSRYGILAETLIFLTGIFALIAIYKNKSNIIFWCKSYLICCLALNFFSIIITGMTENMALMQYIACFLASAYFLSYLTSAMIKVEYPIKKRKHSTWNVVYSGLVIFSIVLYGSIYIAKIF